VFSLEIAVFLKVICAVSSLADKVVDEKVAKSTKKNNIPQNFLIILIIPPRLKRVKKISKFADKLL
jgi:hypothetical protein